MIRCSTCKNNKSNKYFSNASLKSGRKRCLKCSRKATRKSYYKHHKKQIEKSRKYRLNNPDAGKDAKFKYKYGISLKQYESMYAVQEGECKICKEFNDTLDVDHDHSTKEVRGLLCRQCNVGIGHFYDSISLLESAINYLIRFKHL